MLFRCVVDYVGMWFDCCIPLQVSILVIINVKKQKKKQIIYYTPNIKERAKGDWDFRISDLVRNPYGTDI